AFDIFQEKAVNDVRVKSTKCEGQTMKKLVVICALVPLAFAEKKAKPKVVIEVVESQRSVREFSSTKPGTAAESTTNCNRTATARDTGGGTATANGATNCTTTTTPGKPATTTVTRIPLIHVQAIMPNGTHITLWCQ